MGTILNVLSTRLARIVDRARVLVDRLPGAEGALREAIRSELHLLEQRRRLINVAITFCTSTALLVCVVIASAFSAAMMRWDASTWVATLFVMSMLAFIAALVLFLREIVLAVASTRMDLP